MFFDWQKVLPLFKYFSLKVTISCLSWFCKAKAKMVVANYQMLMIFNYA